MNKDVFLPSLKNKRIVVTGAATGIGRETALLLGKSGAETALLDINEAGALETVAAIRNVGAKTNFIKTDIAEEQSVIDAFAEAFQFLGGIDALVHLAGILEGASQHLEGFPIETWDRVIAINLRGSFLAVREAARLMSSKGGVIVLTSSGAGVLGGSSSFAYGASKGGVHGLSMVMQSRIKNKNIRVVDILPGQVATPLKTAQVRTSHEMEEQEGSLKEKLHALASPEDVAKVFAWAISDEASAVRGSIRTI